MNLPKLEWEKIWSNLKTRPLQTGILILFMTCIAVAGFYLTGFLGEIGRKHADEFSTPNDSQSSPRNDVNGSKVEERIYIREQSNSELMDYLNALPPLQREKVVTTSYVDRWVKWKGQISNIVSNHNGTFLVIVSDVDTRSSHLGITFSKAWEPQLEQLREKDLIEYLGKISSISRNGPILDSGELIAPNNSMQQTPPSPPPARPKADVSH